MGEKSEATSKTSVVVSLLDTQRPTAIATTVLFGEFDHFERR